MPDNFAPNSIESILISNVLTSCKKSPMSAISHIQVVAGLSVYVH